jgi:hypothetical protein
MCGSMPSKVPGVGLQIPESGIVLTPEQGEVFNYLLRYRQRD